MLHHEESPEKPQYNMTTPPSFLAKIFRPPYFHQNEIIYNEIIYNETLNVSLSDYTCGSCTLNIVLFVVFLVTSVIISAVFI